MITVKRLSDMSVRKKLYLLIILLVMIPMLLLCIIADVVYISRFERQERNVALNGLMQADNTVGYLLDEVDNISLALLYDDAIQSLYRALVLQKGQVNVNVLRRNVQKSLSAMVFNRSYINAVLVTSGKEKLFESGEGVLCEDPVLYDLAVRQAGRPVWTAAMHMRNTVRRNDLYYVSMLRAVSDLNQFGQMIGVCRISLEESVLGDTLGRFNTFSGSRTIIFNPSGDVVSSTDKTLLGQSMAQTEAFRLIQEDGRHDGYVETTEAGTSLTHLFFRLTDSDWVVMQTVDSRHFQAQLQPIIAIMIGVVLLFLMFTAVYSLVIGRTILRPIRQLYRGIDRMRQGDLDIRLTCTSGDELGQLSQQFSRMAQELKALIATRYEHQILLKEAELRNLESQINPHFLYNTLDTIRWIAVKNKDQEVCEQIEALSDLFRHVLNKGEEMTTLGDELMHLQSYLLLQKARYGDKINVQLSMDKTLLSTPMPKLLIQPLVENAIYHGLEHKVGAGTVSLTVTREDGTLLIVVEDDGIGASGEHIRQRISDKGGSDVFALRNIQERILLRYGEPYGEQFFSQPGIGTRVELRLPIEQACGGEPHEDAGC